MRALSGRRQDDDDDDVVVVERQTSRPAATVRRRRPVSLTIGQRNGLHSVSNGRQPYVRACACVRVRVVWVLPPPPPEKVNLPKLAGPASGSALIELNSGTRRTGPTNQIGPWLRIMAGRALALIPSIASPPPPPTMTATGAGAPTTSRSRSSRLMDFVSINYNVCGSW